MQISVLTKTTAFATMMLASLSAMPLSAAFESDLGALEEARRSHPAVFVPRNVVEYTVGGELGYTFGGDAVQHFKGTFASSDAKLYREAVLDAKRNLYAFLTKGDKSKTVQMSEARKLYEYIDGDVRRVVMFVPKDKVTVLLVQLPPCKESVATQTVEKVKVDSAPEKKTSIAQIPDAPVPLEATAIASPRDNAGKVTSAADDVAILLEKVEKNPDDWTAMGALSKAYACGEEFSKASSLYAKIVDAVVSNETMDKTTASDLILAAARFEQECGDDKLAVKYYRCLVSLDGLRRWGLQKLVDEAKENLSLLDH